MSTFEDFVLLAPREVPLGGLRGMTVHRTLPARATSLIGAWCFVDHFGPDDVSATDGMRVARHPHTGLATVSWLFDGAITHRDSIGSHSLVRPGDVDLMVAGSGITHSEFSTLDTTVLHGVQLWYALPDRARFREQEFTVHTPPEHATARAAVRVGLGGFRATDEDGAALEDRSPVVTDTALGMVQIDLRAGSRLHLELEAGHEHGILVDRGAARLSTVRPGDAGPDSSTPGASTELVHDAAERDLVVLPDGVDHLDLAATGDTDLRVMLLSGEPLGEDIIMWWNFVGRTHEEIVAFRARYQAEIGVELALEDAPIADIARERGGLAADDEQFGPFADHTPTALPAPGLPNGRLRSRGRRELPA
ncbi:pirin family protein [Brachybacterium aquaticum]|uniref:Redox-sensitive bicupin YhaK (Pirin superfamily) n=1 Tax=Brachybacterium aquaticum TaxID=1432564 RepID=A0A841ABD7_9MICO|nr:pirin family protein [Brachybacterium aquaticum]MBB5830675.1 redox-sensitive bicupin YhaK (pirin superfamily) [Brachybacterium aquaticum]